MRFRGTWSLTTLLDDAYSFVLPTQLQFYSIYSVYVCSPTCLNFRPPTCPLVRLLFCPESSHLPRNLRLERHLSRVMGWRNGRVTFDRLSYAIGRSSFS